MLHRQSPESDLAALAALDPASRTKTIPGTASTYPNLLYPTASPTRATAGSEVTAPTRATAGPNVAAHARATAGSKVTASTRTDARTETTPSALSECSGGSDYEGQAQETDNKERITHLRISNSDRFCRRPAVVDIRTVSRLACSTGGYGGAGWCCRYRGANRANPFRRSY